MTEYESRVNKAFGIYEQKMIELSDALKLMAFHLRDTANETYATADYVKLACDSIYRGLEEVVDASLLRGLEDAKEGRVSRINLDEL